jgi:hypothetical protein
VGEVADHIDHVVRLVGTERGNRIRLRGSWGFSSVWFKGCF